MKQDAERIKWVSAGTVPYYAELSGFEWVEMFLRKWGAVEESARLRGILSELNKLEPTKDEFLETCRSSLELYAGYRRDRLARFLAESVRVADPFLRVDRLIYFCPPALTLAEVEAAIDALPPESFGVVKQSARERERRKIQSELARLEAVIAESCPPPFLKLHDGVLSDVREIFTGFWIEKQTKCCAPVGPQGFSLETSPEPEKIAYHALKVGEVINRKTGSLPALR